MKVDSLKFGVLFALLVTAAQRIIGLIRGILFCRILPDDQLGQWSLTWSYLMLLAPLAVLGLPGSFNRYVETYRQQGQLRSFLVRITTVSLITTILFSCLMYVASAPVARLLYRDVSQAPLVTMLATTLFVVVAFNFTASLMEALRQIRLVTVMRLVNGVSFAVLALALMFFWSASTGAILAGFILSCAAGTVPALIYLTRNRDFIDSSRQPLAPRSMWSRVAPFAAWLWIINIVSNLYETVDRAMLLHLAPVSPIEAQALVGQYHSGRIIPLVLVGLAAMLSGILMSYMTASWERGDHAKVSRQLRWTLKLTGLGFTAIGVGVLWCCSAVVRLRTARQILGGPVRAATDAGVLHLVQPVDGGAGLPVVRRKGQMGLCGHDLRTGGQPRPELVADSPIRFVRCGMGHHIIQRHRVACVVPDQLPVWVATGSRGLVDGDHTAGPAVARISGHAGGWCFGVGWHTLRLVTGRFGKARVVSGIPGNVRALDRVAAGRAAAASRPIEVGTRWSTIPTTALLYWQSLQPVSPPASGRPMTNFFPSRFPCRLAIGWLLAMAIGLQLAEMRPGPPTAICDFQPAVSRRRPVTCCVDPAGDQLLVANGRRGTISLIDLANGQLAGEWPVGQRLSDLRWWRNDLYLAADFDAGQLICLRLTAEPGVQIVWRSATISWPRSLLVDPQRKRCYIAGLWSRQLACIELPDEITAPDPPHLALPSTVVNLPFAAGSLCWLADPAPAILAADAFSSRWSCHWPDGLEVVHGGRNLARRAADVAVQPSTGRVCVAGQTLNPLAHAVRNDVHWGLVIGNQVRIYSPDAFFSAPGEHAVSAMPAGGIALSLGGAGAGKADPESITFSGDDVLAITLGGVDQVALGRLDGKPLEYLPVGRRPVAAGFSPDGTRLYVCNQLDDSVTVVNVDQRRVVDTISLGPQPPPTQVDQGESLFFDARLSHDGWMSCHSCHVNGHSNGFLNDNLSDQSTGAPKRVLSLLGHRGTEPLAWNGSFTRLADQITSSIENTMQSDQPPTADQVDALVAYVNALPAPPPLANARAEMTVERIDAGRRLFFQLDCAACHAPELWTSPEIRDIGLIDEAGNSRFNPPSLIGVGQRSAWFHDARYHQLAEVFTRGKHQLDRVLSESELRSLLAFLNSL